MSTSTLTNTDDIEEKVLKAFKDVLNYGNPVAFNNLFKISDLGEYDRAHIIHQLTRVPFKTSIQIINNSKRLQLNFEILEELFDDRELDDLDILKGKNLNQCGGEINPLIH
jgi:hypothetical protein